MKKPRIPKPHIPWGNYPWVVQTLAIIGGLALCGVLLAAFFSIGKGPQRVVVTATPSVDSKDFLLSVSGAAGAPLRQGGSARLLNNGKEFFPALIHAIRNAKSSVNFSCYIWEKGQASDQVLAAMIQRAKAGIEVRVLLDGFGGFRAPEDGIKALRAAGGKVETFRAPRLGKLTRFHKRNHRRAIVIDGAIGYTGGIAVGDKWLGDAEDEKHWRDSMVEVTGPLAATLQSAFVDLWAGSVGELLAGPKFFPPSPDAALLGDPITLHTGIASSPFYEDRPLRFFFIQSFLAARKRLWIATSYFVPDLATREAVAERARAGVDVRLLMPGKHTDARIIRHASYHYFDELLQAGVRIYEYQPTMMHAKTVVVDGMWSVVGSANMDVRGNELNEENVLGILDTEFGRQLEETFLRDLKQSKEIRLEDYRKRWWERPTYWAATLFAQQY